MDRSCWFMGVKWVSASLLLLHQATLHGSWTTLASSEDDLPHQGEIRIGTIFSSTAEPVSRTAMRYAISTNNKNPRTPITFRVLTDVVDIESPFEMTSKMCGQMAQGVFVLYGSTSQHSIKTCQAHSQKFHMPFITHDLTGSVDKEAAPYMLFAKPSYLDAIIDFLKYYNFSHVNYVYDSDDGLQRLQYVYDNLKRDIHYLGMGFHRIYQVESAHEELRQLNDVHVAGHPSHVIVIDVSSTRIYAQLLKQIAEVGMNREGYNYILATMDMERLDVSRFLHGGSKMTGFQLMDSTSPVVKQFMTSWSGLSTGWPGAGGPFVQLEAAISVDSLEVIRRALMLMVKNNSDIFHTTFRRGVIYNMNSTVGVPCNTKPPLPWMHGQEIYQALKQVEFDGVSGRVSFDESGHRQNYSLRVMSVALDTGLQQLGTWYSNYGYLEHDDLTANFTFPPPEERKERTVTTILEAPFLMVRDEINDDGSPLINNNRFKGYVKDLVEELNKKISLDFRLEPVTDGEYGRQLYNGTWTGMIGQLITGKADLAIAPLTITAVRERVVDFSKPFMNVGISIMSKRPEKEKPGLFSFMEPFSFMMWVCIIMAYVAISGCIFAVSRLSPYEPTAHDSRRHSYRSNFNLCNSFWFAMGALMMQGSDLCPRSPAGRIIGGAWWFFVLIIISSYTANLAAFLTIERMVQPIASADDLVKQTDISYGVLETGTTREFFETSNVTTYQRMWSYMSSATPSVMVKSLEEGVNRVRNSGGKYIFLLQSSQNDYFNNRKPCSTLRVGPNLNLEGFGIATPLGSPLKKQLNYVALKLKEDGTLHRLQQKWWQEEGECGSATGNKESKKRSLSLSNVAGVFLLLIGGLVIAIGTGLLEARYLESQYKKCVHSVPTTDDRIGPERGYSNGHVTRGVLAIPVPKL